MISLLGIYRRRDTPMHAAPAWSKAVLMLVAAIVMLIVSDPVTSLGIMGACLMLLASTVPPLWPTLRGMAIVTVVALLTVSFQVWRGEIDRAIDIGADLIAIAALALAISSSTPMEEMLDVVAGAFRPLRRILPPDTIGLMFALTLRAIPEVARILVESRNAARARGLDRNLRAILVPTTTRTVGFALLLGQALHARGIADEAHAPRRHGRHGERRLDDPPPSRPDVEDVDATTDDHDAASAPVPASPTTGPDGTPLAPLRSRRERRRSG